jgi:membrane-bound lytic murein transglycosylase F
MRWVWGAAVAACLAGPTPALAGGTEDSAVDTHPTRYDEHFRKWSKRYFGPGFDWRWFKAQAVVESRLKPNAVGPSGGRGLMQILPSTYAFIRKKNPAFGGIEDPRWNIAAGIFYNRYLYEQWTDEIPHREETLNFTFASYNAGPGRIGKARTRTRTTGKDPDRWTLVEHHAPRITRRYVRHIHELMGSQVHAPGSG